MRVGFCWAGSKSHKNDGMRSLPVKTIGPLAVVPGVEWVSLARDAWTEAMGQGGLPNALADCADWYDTGRVVADLDLVITVDTAIAHLAAGLWQGPPVWMLVTAVPDFRWMLDRSETPWYRRMRIYRQRIAGEWGPVIEQVARDLIAEVHQRRRVA